MSFNSSSIRQTGLWCRYGGRWVWETAANTKVFEVGQLDSVVGAEFAG